MKDMEAKDWILITQELPPKRQCDMNCRSGYSNPIIVSDGKKVWDDVTACYDYDAISEKTEISFWVHNFGYSNDSYSLTGITHWMPLPEPPLTGTEI